MISLLSFLQGRGLCVIATILEGIMQKMASQVEAERVPKFWKSANLFGIFCFPVYLSNPFPKQELDLRFLPRLSCKRDSQQS